VTPTPAPIKLDDVLPEVPLRYAELRLRKHAHFQRVYASSRKQFSKEMTFFCALREASSDVPDTAGPRFGLTVGKVMGKAHDRNRMKRRMRAAIFLHAALLGEIPVDVVLHPRRSVLTLEWDKLQREVAQVFRQIRKQCAGQP
jgi:ribonuclease P protein component